MGKLKEIECKIKRHVLFEQRIVKAQVAYLNSQEEPRPEMATAKYWVHRATPKIQKHRQKSIDRMKYFKSKERMDAIRPAYRACCTAASKEKANAR